MGKGGLYTSARHDTLIPRGSTQDTGHASHRLQLEHATRQDMRHDGHSCEHCSSECCSSEHCSGERIDHRRQGGEGGRIMATEKISIDSPALVKVAKGVDLVVGVC